ncbi:M48 family metalloprotease [bacterium]|nr:M48 family metalloprotease [bacterium]MBU1026036.1 M48 family metalloprotease [bacterium]
MANCRRCKKSIPEEVVICPNCGATQSSRLKKKVDRLEKLDQLDQDIEKRLENLENDFGKKSSTGRSKIKSTELAGIQSITAAKIDENIQKFIIPVDAEFDLEEYLPDSSEIENYRKLVFESHLVTTNPLYASYTNETLFNYRPDDMRINAFATRTNLGPKIVITAGLVREFMAAAIFAIAQSLEGSETLISQSKARFGAAYNDNSKIELPQEIPQKVFELIIVQSKDVLGSMLVFVIAHELGHIIYGHVYGSGYDEQPIDISRNQERDADSFASSVIASSRFSHFLVQGQLLALYVFALSEARSGESTEPGTHPLAMERLKNAVKANSKAAEDLGFTEKMIDEFFTNSGGM